MGIHPLEKATSCKSQENGEVCVQIESAAQIRTQCDHAQTTAPPLISVHLGSTWELNISKSRWEPGNSWCPSTPLYPFSPGFHHPCRCPKRASSQIGRFVLSALAFKSHKSTRSSFSKHRAAQQDAGGGRGGSLDLIQAHTATSYHLPQSAASSLHAQTCRAVTSWLQASQTLGHFTSLIPQIIPCL